jgi:hypothetical protein
LTDGGLGDVNPARSFREIKILGHCREVTQVTQFHLRKAPYRKQLSVKERGQVPGPYKIFLQNPKLIEVIFLVDKI